MSGVRLAVRVGPGLAFVGTVPGKMTFLCALEARLLSLVLLDGRLIRPPCRGLRLVLALALSLLRTVCLQNVSETCTRSALRIACGRCAPRQSCCPLSHAAPSSARRQRALRTTDTSEQYTHTGVGPQFSMNGLPPWLHVRCRHQKLTLPGSSRSPHPGRSDLPTSA
jgi:hypothetical protein